VVYSLLSLFVITTVVRTLIMAMCQPIFKHLEYGFSWSEVLVCSWGGLRGAVGLALALVVYLDQRIDTKTRERVFFCTAGIVCSTLLVLLIDYRRGRECSSALRGSCAAPSWYY
jgi:sodium/hydrogen exchanger 10/11